MLLENLTIVKEFELILRKQKGEILMMLEKYISIHSQLNAALRISYDDNINKIVDIYILNNLKPTNRHVI